MIRINLLAVERERAKRRAGLQAGQKVTIGCSLILLVTAVGLGWWFWSLREEAARIEQEIVAAQQETARLRSVLDEVQRFEQQRTQLQQRVALIEELRKGQSAPVRLLDEVSRSLPDRLWLTEFRQEGADLTLDGRATSLTALSDFVANLEASRYFRRPVEILDSQVERQNDIELVRFSIKAQFAPPSSGASPSGE